eukprot:NODE_145_length_15762_cov_0.655238.p6 type:complete len:152 gc:universal NODE_145_length_15762_cov_0.655238:3491-3036(-)
MELFSTLLFLCNYLMKSSNFDLFSCRRLDNKLNIFHNLLKNLYFCGVMILTVALQFIIMFIGGSIFKIAPVGAYYWLLSIALGFVGLFVGIFARLVPNRIFCCTSFKSERVIMNAERIRWQHAIGEIQTKMRVTKAFQGSNPIPLQMEEKE